MQRKLDNQIILLSFLTFLACSASTANAVDVGLGIVREVEVDNHSNVINI